MFFLLINISIEPNKTMLCYTSLCIFDSFLFIRNNNSITSNFTIRPMDNLPRQIFRYA